MIITTLYMLHTKSLQSCPALCEPMACSPPGSSIHGILQARVLEWIAMLFSRGSSQPRYWTHVSLSPALAGRFFPISTTWEALSAGSCYLFPLLWVEGFPCGSAGKESAYNVEDLGSIPGVGKIPWKRERLPTPVSWLGESCGQSMGLQRVRCDRE